MSDRSKGPSTETRAPLRGTPGLEQLLSRLRRRLTTTVMLHGLGTVLTVAVAWLVFLFLADWGLHVPGPVRLLHTTLLVGLPAWFLWRDLIRPLRRIPDRAGLALLIERSRPELRELLVSAVQLQESAPPEADPALVQRVLAEAEAEVEGLTLEGVLDRRPPTLRFGSGLLCTLVAVLLLVKSPLHTRILFDRMLGGGTPWPQRTYLRVEVTSAGAIADPATPAESGSSSSRREVILVRVARGSDVPVLITAEGVVPEEVVLHFVDGEKIMLAPSGGARGNFRTTLRSCQEDLSFHVTGGDDRDRLPMVHVEVLQPPDVVAVAVEVTPPPYSGMSPSTVANRDVEVLAGSSLRVHVLPEPRAATGLARTLPENEEYALTRGPFPDLQLVQPADGTAPPADAAADGETGLSFELTAERSLRYRFELLDASGLSNPEPGLFAIHVLEDHAPEVRVLAPARTSIDTVAGGLLPLRISARDDFGLVSAGWRVLRAGAEAQLLASGELELRQTEPEEQSAAGARATSSARIEVSELVGADPGGAEGQQFNLEVRVLDNRRPEAGEGVAAPVRVRIVSSDELLRRIQDRLARARLQAGTLAELQREKRRRVEELIASLGSDSPLLGGDVLALQAALSGQRRVQGDALALARELGSVAESVLYARLDEKAGALVEHFDGLLEGAVEESFAADAWRELASAQRSGSLGSAGFAGHLVDMVDLSVEIGDEHARSAVLELDRAVNAVEIASIQEALVAASDSQARTLASMELLLERLAEWDNFQSVLALTRDILKRQQALRDRTREFAQEK